MAGSYSQDGVCGSPVSVTLPTASAMVAHFQSHMEAPKNPLSQPFLLLLTSTPPKPVKSRKDILHRGRETTLGAAIEGEIATFQLRGLAPQPKRIINNYVVS